MPQPPVPTRSYVALSLVGIGVPLALAGAVEAYRRLVGMAEPGWGWHALALFAGLVPGLVLGFTAAFAAGSAHRAVFTLVVGMLAAVVVAIAISVLSLGWPVNAPRTPGVLIVLDVLGLVAGLALGGWPFLVAAKKT